MWRSNHWHIPEKYRGPQAFSWGFVILYSSMFIFMFLGILIAPFLETITDTRMIYSEVYMVNAGISETGDAILMECDYGWFKEELETTFNVDTNEDVKIVNLQTSKSDEARYSSKFLISVPITDTDTQIVLQQENGLKQLVVEKDKENGLWKPASSMSRFLFFAKNHTLMCVLSCVISLIIIVGGFFSIKTISKKIRIKKYKEKDPFTDEL